MASDGLNKLSAAAAIVLIAMVGLGFFFLGRQSVRIPDPQVIYKDSDTLVCNLPPVYVTIKAPQPVVVTPADTVYYPVPAAVDTAALFATWRDYYAVREYNLDFSSDSTGVFQVGAKVTQNKITEATANIQPQLKIITNTEVRYRQRAVQPWVMVSTSPNFRFQQIQGGVDLGGSWMIGAGAVRFDNSGAFTISVGKKF